MNSNLTPKECSLLTELKGQEQLCIQKYRRSSEAAVDGQLKGLFSHIADIEQQHFDTLTQIENGSVPQPKAAGKTTPPTFTEIYGTADTHERVRIPRREHPQKPQPHPGRGAGARQDDLRLYVHQSHVRLKSNSITLRLNWKVLHSAGRSWTKVRLSRKERPAS